MFYYHLNVYLFLQLRRIHPNISWRQEPQRSGLLRLPLQRRSEEESRGAHLVAIVVVIVLLVVLLPRISYSPCYPCYPPPPGCVHCCVCAPDGLIVALFGFVRPRARLPPCVLYMSRKAASIRVGMLEVWVPGVDTSRYRKKREVSSRTKNSARTGVSLQNAARRWSSEVTPDRSPTSRREKRPPTRSSILAGQLSSGAQYWPSAKRPKVSTGGTARR